MNIAENILKHNLQRVYFLSGTAMAGKTTMAQTLAKKHGLIHFNDNWHEDHFAVYQSICNEKYQPLSSPQCKNKEPTGKPILADPSKIF